MLMGQVIEELEKEKAREHMSAGGSQPKKKIKEKAVSGETPLLLAEKEKRRAAGRVFGSSKENSSSSNEPKLLPEKKGQTRDAPASPAVLSLATCMRKIMIEGASLLNPAEEVQVVRIIIQSAASII